MHVMNTKYAEFTRNFNQQLLYSLKQTIIKNKEIDVCLSMNLVATCPAVCTFCSFLCGSQATRSTLVGNDNGVRSEQTNNEILIGIFYGISFRNMGQM